MKYLTVILAFTLTISYSCKYSSSKVKNELLTSSDSLEIIKGVTAALDLYADANNALDGERITNFWSKSPKMIFIVNTVIYSDWNIIHDGCVEFYSSPIDSTYLNWMQRSIIPISNNHASVYGRYEMYLRIESGEVLLDVNPYFTAIMVKEDNMWKVLRGHESHE